MARGRDIGVKRRTAAECAGTMTGGEGYGFIEEEKLGIGSGLHDVPMPVFPLEHTNDPGFVPPSGVPHLAMKIVKYPSVSHE